MADYVVLDTQSKLLEIKVMTAANEPVVIAPIENGINAVITEVTDPTMGTAIINGDNTITYTPNAEAIGTDGFSYSEQITNPDQTITTASGNVKVTINSAVSFWKAKFDKQYNAGDGAKMLELSMSGNKFQEYYYMYYYFDGMLSIWQATGDNSYLNTMLTVIKNTMKDAKAVDFDSSYLGWKSDSSYGQDYDKNGVALWESYYWKAVTTLLRMMHHSPQLMNGAYTGGAYRDEYNKILAFTEKHIWNKWEAKGSSYIYRNHTHMASHWARMGMELYIITGKQKYKDVFDNISFGKMTGEPSNLRDRIYANPSVPNAIAWNMVWDSNKVQDTPHASDVVTFMILAHENEMYWSKADIDGLVVTLDKVVFPTKDAPKYNLNVDGSGGYDVPGRLRDWVKLGRYNKSLQNRLINEYQSDNANARRYAIQNLGNFALNEKILADGVPVYPEIHNP